jgi:hypothetical protein
MHTIGDVIDRWLHDPLGALVLTYLLGSAIATAGALSRRALQRLRRPGARPS